MPHKRAKASIRKANSLRMGFDLPPSQQLNHNKKRNKRKREASGSHQTNSPDISKNVFRILNAEKIRAEFQLRKSQALSQALNSNLSADSQSRRFQTSLNKQKSKSSDSSKTSDQLKILPGEGLGSFNRRVEENLRPQVTAAFKAARKRQTGPSEADRIGKGSSSGAADQGEFKAKIEEESNLSEVKKTNQIKDFAPRPSKFPITDTVMAPPSLKLTKSMKKALDSASTPYQTPLPISSAQKRIMELERDKAIKRYRLMKAERYALD